MKHHAESTLSALILPRIGMATHMFLVRNLASLAPAVVLLEGLRQLEELTNGIKHQCHPVQSNVHDWLAKFR